MSELININDNRATIRWKLLASASALAMSAYGLSAVVAKAEDANRPVLWVELDGQFSQQRSDLELFAPPFLAGSPFDGASHLDLEKSGSTIWDKGAKLSYQPSGSDWILSLSARYGKIGRHETRDSHPTTAYMTKYSGTKYNAYQRFTAHNNEDHAIVDFQVGKDIGLGRFGNDATSLMNFGVRIAQFNSRNHVSIKSQPGNSPTGYTADKFYASFAAKRRFMGIGPSLSWDASAAIVGNSRDGGITLDWGLNAAVLFGRQRMSAHNQTSENHFNNYVPHSVYQTSDSTARSKSVMVPNLGGFAGISWRYTNAKISLGYKADYFFGVLDGGIAARKTENRGFMGPFASVSIGLGD